MARPSSRLKRKKPTLSLKRRMYIFCEDQNAAPQYFTTLHAASRLFEIVVYPACGVPKTIVDKCLEKKSAFNRNSGDEAWAVFDRDAHEDYDASIDRCDASGVGVAVTNPCFELWILLHQERFDKPDDRHQVQKRCSESMAEYDSQRKSLKDAFSLISKIEIAEENARWLLQQRTAAGDSRDPPSTTVHVLTARIRSSEWVPLPRSPER